MSQPSPQIVARLPLYLVVGILVVVTVAFLVVFAVTTGTEARTKAPVQLKDDTYLATVNDLLVDADPANGARLIEQYDCIACHRVGVANNVAPPFVGVAQRAAARRPPLTAAAYIYESITNPTAFVVDTFSPAMPQNYPQRLLERELGDIIAYLLTAEAG